MDLSKGRNKNNREKAKFDLSTLIYGKVPPQARDLEEALLGIMMLESNAVMEVRQLLHPEDFYIDAHQKICKAIYTIDERGPVDILLVVEKLKELGELDLVGGPFYITRLTNSVVSNANIIRHARIIKQFSVVRKLITTSGEIINMAYDGADMFDLLSYAEENLFALNTDIESSQTISREAIAVNVAIKFDERVQAGTDPTVLDKYIKSGITAWDEYTGYLQPGGLYVVAARPGMGKTDFAIEVINNVAKTHDVGFVSAEMTEEQIAQRFISRAYELNNDVFTTRKPEWITSNDQEKFMFGLQHFVNLKLWLETGNKIDRIIAKMKYWVRKIGVKLIIIDYLQLIKVLEELSKYMTEVQMLNHVLEKIRVTAKELKVPVILLSQLNRELYKHGSKEPNISHLKGSGAIEEAAGMISFLHRPEYYDITTDEDGESTRGLMYQIIAKHRWGKTGKVKHLYVPQYSKIDVWKNTIAFDPMNTTFYSSDNDKEDLPF
jgi:replicative DNA helicase